MSDEYPLDIEPTDEELAELESLLDDPIHFLRSNLVNVDPWSGEVLDIDYVSIKGTRIA